MKIKIKYIIGIILLVCFVLLLGLVLTNKIEIFDSKVYDVVTIFKSDYITSIYKFITFFGSTMFIVFLCLLFLVIFWKRKGYLIAACLIISTVLNNVVKLLVRRQRPLSLMMVEENTFSFPSGHTMAAVSMYGIIIYFVYKSSLNKWVKYLLIGFLSLLIVGVAVSRIYLGAHYASDVIAGILLSLVWLIIYTSFVDKHNKIADK